MQNEKNKPSYEELELEIKRLERRPTIYEILRMPLKGLPIDEAKHYLQTTLDGLGRHSRVD